MTILGNLHYKTEYFFHSRVVTLVGAGLTIYYTVAHVYHVTAMAIPRPVTLTLEDVW